MLKDSTLPAGHDDSSASSALSFGLPPSDPAFILGPEDEDGNDGSYDGSDV